MYFLVIVFLYGNTNENMKVIFLILNPNTKAKYDLFLILWSKIADRSCLHSKIRFMNTPGTRYSGPGQPPSATSCLVLQLEPQLSVTRFLHMNILRNSILVFLKTPQHFKNIYYFSICENLSSFIKHVKSLQLQSLQYLQ